MMSHTPRCIVLLACCLMTMPSTRADGDLALFGPGAPIDETRLTTTDAMVHVVASADGDAIQVSTGTQATWPGIAILAPSGSWDLQQFAQIELTVKNTGTSPVTVNCRVDNAAADGIQHCVSGSVRVESGGREVLQVLLSRTAGDQLDGQLFGMRGYPVTSGGPRTIDPSQVTQLLLFVNRPSDRYTFEVSDIRATGSWTPPTAWTSDATPYTPLIDTFGQYRHKDWPGKVHSLEQLRELRAAEAKVLASDAGPSAWNQYGGWRDGPQLNATGFFRVEKLDGKWWLVDPEGRLFWSHGIDCVRMLDSTAVEEREQWFEAFPGDDPDFQEFVSTYGRVLKGHYAGRRTKGFSFAGANLKRKYGDQWRQAVSTVMHERLRHWGLNTIGNWSDEEVRLQRKTPYVDAIGSGGTPDIEGSEGYWGKFPDVFDSKFESSLRQSMAGRKSRSANDPWCLGYFSDNELSWGDELSLAVATLASPPEQAAKRAFVADLKQKYASIEAMNQVWKSNYATWEAMLESRERPDVTAAREDLEAFYSRAANTYFSTVKRVIQEIAPHQLYLGCRFAWVNPLAAAAAANHCDVVSYNLYRRSVADFAFNGQADVPLIIGEFHFGALDRGMFHTGLVSVSNQAARARAYHDYVEGALQHPQFVGCHWFQYQDQPTTGRILDEENYQIGFVNIADTPHEETTSAARAIGERLYEIRANTR